MQHLDNDMDEIFHKAGNNYPLDTTGSNWDAVRAGLNDENPIIHPNKKDKRKFLWLLLMLLPLAWLKFKNEPPANLKTNLKAETEKNQSPAVENKVAVNEDQNKIINNDKQDQSSDELLPKKVQSEAAPVRQSASATTDEIKQKQTAASVNKNSHKNISFSKPVTEWNAVNTKTKSNISYHTIKAKNKVAHKFIQPENGKQFTTKDEFVNTDDLPEYAYYDNLLAPLFGAYSINNIKKQLPSHNPITENAVSTINKKKPVNKNQSKVYVGLIVGPDFSWIKSQEVKQTGYSAGLSVGYKLNKHFAFELGLLYDQKKYFTNGEYFDKTGAGVPSTVSIKWLNGGCNMFEFPLAARYNFNIKKSDFFVSTGFTSYIMKKEGYTYSAVANGSWYEGHRSYNNSGNHLFSNMQWSLGYNKKISPSTQLRIEPYIKIPVKNIGIGKMPITSSGVYLGITRDLR